MSHSDTLIDGLPVPSVTQITGMLSKPFLMAWYGKYGNRLCMRKLKVSGQIGDQFHDLVSQIVNGIEVVPATRRLTGMCASFSAWYKENHFVPEVQEFKVVSNIHRYAGTLDAIGTLNGGTELVLLDWKSSSGIYPEMGYQLAAYMAAYAEQQGTKMTKGWIIQVDKKPPYLLHTRLWEDLDQKFECFLGLLRVYQDLHPQKPPKVKKGKKVKV
jgi:hypothetical protein